MVGRADKLAELARLARLKSDLELKRFAAFHSNVDAARQRIARGEDAVGRFYDADAPLSLSDARLAGLEVARIAREAAQARQDLSRMLPRFEQARRDAMQAFGRANVLHDLSGRAGRPR